MIFLITSKETAEDNNLFGFSKYSEAITVLNDCSSLFEYFKDIKHIQLDTETSGFDVHTCELLTVQLGTNDVQYVVDMKHINIQELKPLLEDESKNFILQNAKFDLRFFYKHNIYIKNIYDTLLAECILTTGLDHENRKLSLDALAKKYTDGELDKTIRGDIHFLGLSKKVVRYAADDVKYLEGIMDKQLIELESKDLLETLKLENEFVKVLAYTEYCGFHLDESLWIKNYENNLVLYKKAKEDLDDYLRDNKIKGYVSNQLSIFEEDKAEVNIEWSSSKQVVKLFKKLGIETKVIEKGEIKDSVEAKHLEKYVNKHYILPLYLKYKGLEKQISTYGLSFLKHINPKTKRVHCNYWQIVNTGRLSSRDPNLQNITADESVRSCFRAEKGNLLSINDYSSQEPRTLASLSNDKNLIDFFKNGDGDIHSFVASKLYSVIENKEVIITKEDKEKRQVGKVLNLKLNYGATAYTVKDDLNTSQEEAQFFIDALASAFPEKENYFKKKIKETFDNGYITTNHITRRKIFIEGIDRVKTLKDTINKIKNEGREIPKSLYREFAILRGRIERASKNYPIQGTSADQTKLAGIIFFNYLTENNLLNTVKICSFIHDEIVVEFPESLKSSIPYKLQDSMEKAFSVFCNNVPVEASPNICEYWKK
jgi:DNA polymerase-1